MGLINNKFDHVYVINLPGEGEQKIRREAIAALFSKLEIDYELYSAINGSELGIDIPKEPGKRWNTGAYGLAITTMNILTDAKLKGYKNILIFEDDVEAHDLYDVISEELLQDIPKTYDLLFLGYTLKSPGSPVMVEENGFPKCFPFLKTMQSGYSCHAYAVNAHMYDFYKHLISSLDQPIDIHTNTIMSRQNSFYTIQKLFHQKSGYSFIEGGNYDTSFTK